VANVQVLYSDPTNVFLAPFYEFEGLTNANKIVNWSCHAKQVTLYLFFHNPYKSLHLGWRQNSTYTSMWCTYSRTFLSGVSIWLMGTGDQWK